MYANQPFTILFVEFSALSPTPEKGYNAWTYTIKTNYGGRATFAQKKQRIIYFPTSRKEATILLLNILERRDNIHAMDLVTSRAIFARRVQYTVANRDSALNAMVERTKNLDPIASLDGKYKGTHLITLRGMLINRQEQIRRKYYLRMPEWFDMLIENPNEVPELLCYS
jgi:hypothetical protein